MRYLVFYLVTGIHGEVVYSGSVTHETFISDPERVAESVKQAVREQRQYVEVHVTGMIRLDA